MVKLKCCLRKRQKRKRPSKKILVNYIMPKFYNQTNEELEAPPPSYKQMTKMVGDRVKRRVKNTIMPKVRAKVAALGKAKVAEKKAQAKKITKAAGKMEGRVKEKKRVKAGKKQIIKGIKKIGAEELAKKKEAGKRLGGLKAKMPRIQAKVAKLGKQKASERRKVGRRVNIEVRSRIRKGDVNNTGFDAAYHSHLEQIPNPSGRGDDLFHDPLTDVVYDRWRDNTDEMKPYIMGTMYGGNFKAKKSASSAAFADDSDIDVDDELEVDEINFDASTGRFGNGKMYYLTEDGKIYNPDTSERVPSVEFHYEGEVRGMGFGSVSEAMAERSFIRSLQS